MSSIQGVASCFGAAGHLDWDGFEYCSHNLRLLWPDSPTVGAILQEGVDALVILNTLRAGKAER
jgi:hypothetical protein